MTTERKNRKINLEEKPYNNFYKFIKEMTDKNLYGKYILENYTEYEIEELEKEIIRISNEFKYDEKYEKFNKKYNYLDDGEATKRVVEEIFK